MRTVLSANFRPFRPLIQVIASSFRRRSRITPFRQVEPTPTIVNQRPRHTLFRAFRVRCRTTIFDVRRLRNNPTSICRSRSVTRASIVSRPIIGRSTGKVSPLTRIHLSKARRVTRNVVRARRNHVVYMSVRVSIRNFRNYRNKS